MTENKEDSEVGEEDGILECVSHCVTGCEKIVEDEYVNSKEDEYDGNMTDSVSEVTCDPSTPLTSVELVEMADMMWSETDLTVTTAARPGEEESRTVDSGGADKIDQFVMPPSTTDTDKSRDSCVDNIQVKKSKWRARWSRDKRRRHLVAYHQQMVAEKGWPLAT